MVENIQGLASKAREKRKEGEFQDAIRLYSQCIELAGEDKAFHLSNRAITYMEAGDYSLELEDYKYLVVITDSRFIPDDYFIYQGICHLYLEQSQEVLPVWKKGLTAPYTDAAGGVVIPSLILYGAERIGDPEAERLALHLLEKPATRGSEGWPGAIVPFLLGRIDTDEFLNVAHSTSSEVLRARWQCQADFYIGLRAIRGGQFSKSKDAFRRCSNNPYGCYEAEYFLARWEVMNNFPDPAFD